MVKGCQRESGVIAERFLKQNGPPISRSISSSSPITFDPGATSTRSGSNSWSGKQSRRIATRNPSMRTAAWPHLSASTPSRPTSSPGVTSSWARSRTRYSKKSRQRSAPQSEADHTSRYVARVLYVWLMNQFFESLGQDWVDAAKRRGVAIAKPALDSQIALELLELARVAAHTQERRFAPLTSFLAGVAAQRLPPPEPEIDDAAPAPVLLAGRQKLEAEVPGL